jgi:hypothetical protein
MSVFGKSNYSPFVPAEAESSFRSFPRIQEKAFSPLVPAKAGTQGHLAMRGLLWIPACAGMTGVCRPESILL